MQSLEDLKYMGVDDGMREVSADEFAAFHQRCPEADYVIVTPVGEAGPERFFIKAG